MSVMLRVHSVHLLTFQRAAHPRDGFLVLSTGHCVRELIDFIVVVGSVYSVQPSSANSFCCWNSLKGRCTKVLNQLLEGVKVHLQC